MDRDYLSEDLAALAGTLKELDFGGSTVLVTGVTGLVGSLIVRAICAYNKTYGEKISCVGLARNEEKTVKTFAKELADPETAPFLSFIYQGNNHLTGILLAFPADQDAFFFHALEQGGDCVCLQEQPFGDIIHRLGVLLPQDLQHEILRISQPVLREKWVIGLCEKSRSGVEPETELVVQLEFLVDHNIPWMSFSMSSGVVTGA
jgi:hypothetical protein